MSYPVWVNDTPKLELKEKIQTKERIKYIYFQGCKYSEIWFQESKYSKEEMKLVDELFANLDESNLAMIKGILHSKTKSKKYIRVKDEDTVKL